MRLGTHQQQADVCAIGRWKCCIGGCSRATEERGSDSRDRSRRRRVAVFVFLHLLIVSLRRWRVWLSRSCVRDVPPECHPDQECQEGEQQSAPLCTRMQTGRERTHAVGGACVGRRRGRRGRRERCVAAPSYYYARCGSRTRTGVYQEHLGVGRIAAVSAAEVADRHGRCG